MLKRFVVSSSPCMLPSQSAAIPVGLPGHSVSLVVIPTLFINYLLVDECCCCCCCWSCTDQTLSGACDRCTVPRAEISLTQSRPTWWQMFRGAHTNTATKRRHVTAPHFTTSHVSVLFTATDSAVALVIDGGVGTKSSAEANRNET